MLDRQGNIQKYNLLRLLLSMLSLNPYNLRPQRHLGSCLIFPANLQECFHSPQTNLRPLQFRHREHTIFLDLMRFFLQKLILVFVIYHHTFRSIKQQILLKNFQSLFVFFLCCVLYKFRLLYLLFPNQLYRLFQIYP